MTAGYIKLWRSSLDSGMYFAEPFSRWQAWIDLLLLANFQDNVVYVRGIPVDVKRGQVLAGEEFLGTRWKWSRGKVRRFIKLLSSKTVQQIELHTEHNITVITIVNWGIYQGEGIVDGQQTVQQTGQQTDNKRTTNGHTKESKEGKERLFKKEGKEKKIKTGFDIFWETYPRKEAKEKARQGFVKINPSEELLETILKAIKLQQKTTQWLENGGKFIPLPASWLNGKRWEDEVPTANTPKSPEDKRYGIEDYLPEVAHEVKNNGHTPVIKPEKEEAHG